MIVWLVIEQGELRMNTRVYRKRPEAMAYVHSLMDACEDIEYMSIRIKPPTYEERDGNQLSWLLSPVNDDREQDFKLRLRKEELR